MSRAERLNEELATLLQYKGQVASVYRNPRPSELTELAKESRVIRFIYVVKSDDIYMWNAALGIHHSVALQLGLPITLSTETHVRIDGQATVKKSNNFRIFELTGNLTSKQEEMFKRKYRLYQ